MLFGSVAAVPESVAERRARVRPEGQTLSEWVEERVQVQTDVE